MDRHLSTLHWPGLDGLRGFAVLLVFATHYGGGRHFQNPLLRTLGEIVAGGWIGVDLFFVLSGFLITGILLDTANGQDYYRTFYARRALRIFPVYYGVLLVLLCSTPFLGIDWKVEHLSFFTYTNNIVILFFPALNVVSPIVNFGAYWSLAVEEQFYLAWPFLVRHAVGARIYWLIAGCIGLAFLIRLVCWHFGIMLGAYNLMVARMDSLAIGALLAVLLRRTSFLDLSPKVPYAILAACLATWLALGLYEGTLFVETWPMLTVGLTIVAVGSGALVWLGLRKDTLVARLCTFAPLCAIGKYSYGLYVYHLLFLEPLRNYIYPILIQYFGSATLAAPVYFFISAAWNILFAAVSYHFFEIRFLRLKELFPYRDRVLAPRGKALLPVQHLSRAATGVGHF